MLKKLLASIGIGKAKIDTILLEEQLRAGDNFNIEIVITGGDVEQELNAIELAIMAESKAEAELSDGDDTYIEVQVLQHWTEQLNLTIQPGEVISNQLELHLHPEIPATSLFGHEIGRVWLETGLDIKNGLDGSDADPLIIVPSPTQMAVLEMFQQSGFRLFKADIESGQIRTRDFVSHLPCYQEYEFKPSSRSLFGVRELEVTFIDNGTETGVLLEIDRAFIGDGYRSISIPNHCTTPASVKPYVEKLLP